MWLPFGKGVETTLNPFKFKGPLKTTDDHDGIPLLGGSSQLVSGYEPLAFGLPKFLALWLTTEMVFEGMKVRCWYTLGLKHLPGCNRQNQGPPDSWGCGTPSKWPKNYGL